MDYDVLILASKLTALAIFFPIYLGALVYAYWGPNRAMLEAYGRIPLTDEDPTHG